MKRLLLVAVLLFTVPLVMAGVDTEFLDYGHNWFFNDTAEQGASPAAYAWTQVAGTPEYNDSIAANGSKSIAFESGASEEIEVNLSVYGTPEVFNITWKWWVSDDNQDFFIDLKPETGTGADAFRFGVWSGGGANVWESYDGNSWEQSAVTINEKTWTTHTMQINTTSDAYVWWIDGTEARSGTSGVNDHDRNSLIWQFDHESGASGGYVDDFHFWNYTANNTPPVVPGTDGFFSESAFSSQFDDDIVIGAAYGTTASTTFTSVNTTQQGYFTATITTNGTGGDTTAQCRISVDGLFHGSTRTRSISSGTLGNFRLTTTNVTLTAGNHTVFTECQKTGGPGYTVTGTTISGHLLYDSSQDKNLTYQYNETGSLTLPASYSPIYNWSFTTSTLHNGSSSNTLYILTEWRASPTYGSDGNISTYVTIDGDACANYTRYGSSGSTGSTSGSCYRGNFTNTTTYDLSLWAQGDGIIDVQFHTKELIQNNQSVNITFLNDTPVDGSSPTTLSSLAIANLIGGNYNIFMQAGVNILTNSTSTTSHLALQETTTLRNNSRTLSSSGQPGNVMVEGISAVSGTGVITAALVGSCDNSLCVIDHGDFVVYATDTVTTTDNQFTVTAYDQYNLTALNVFNVTIGGATIATTTGSVTITTNDTNPTVIVSATNYFSNVSAHDRTTDLNASMTTYTLIQAFGVTGSQITNFSTSTNGSSNQSTTTSRIYLPLNSSAYNVTVFAANESGSNFSTTNAILNATPFLQAYNFTLSEAHTFHVLFYNESSDTQLTNETSYLQLISDTFAQNYSTTNGTLYITLLVPNEYTLRYYIDPDIPRDYYTTLAPQSSQNLTLYVVDEDISNFYLPIIQDEGLNPIASATVSLLRYFISTNSYRVVEMARTDTLGEAVLRVVPNVINYRLLITDGTTTTTTAPTKFTASTNTYTLSSTGNFLQSFSALPGITHSLTFNNATNTYIFTWSDNQNIVTEGCLQVDEYNATGIFRVYDQCSSGASGSTIYTVLHTNNTRYVGKAYMTTNTQYSTLPVTPVTAIFTSGTATFGLVGILIMLVLLTTMGFQAIESGTDSLVITTVLGLIVIGFIGIISYRWEALVGIFIVGGLYLYLAKG